MASVPHGPLAAAGDTIAAAPVAAVTAAVLPKSRGTAAIRAAILVRMETSG